MSEKIAKSIGRTQEEIEIIQYGMHRMFLITINLLTVFVCGVFWHELLFDVYLCGIIFLIRPYTGGYHADTEIRCYFLSVGIINLAIACKHFKIISDNLLWLAYLISMVIIVRYAPVMHPEHLLDEKEVQLYSGKAKLYTIFICIALVLGMLLDIRILIETILYAVLIVAVGMVAGKLKFKKVKF